MIMALDLVFRNSGKNSQFDEEFFRTLLKHALEVVSALHPTNYDLQTNYDISVNLVDEEKIKELNKRYRGEDKPTNVLSFPLEIPREQEFRRPEQAKRIEGLPIDLGDIFLCLSIAKKEALEENKAVVKHVSWMTVHGFLHLLGYDHERSEKDAQEMSALEEKILTNG